MVCKLFEKEEKYIDPFLEKWRQNALDFYTENVEYGFKKVMMKSKIKKNSIVVTYGLVNALKSEDDFCLSVYKKNKKYNVVIKRYED